MRTYSDLVCVVAPQPLLCFWISRALVEFSSRSSLPRSSLGFGDVLGFDLRPSVAQRICLLFCLIQFISFGCFTDVV